MPTQVTYSYLTVTSCSAIKVSQALFTLLKVIFVPKSIHCNMTAQIVIKTNVVLVEKLFFCLSWPSRFCKQYNTLVCLQQF